MNEISDEMIERIIAFCIGDISGPEKDILEDWVNESLEHERKFNSFVRQCRRLQLTVADERAEIMRQHIRNHCFTRVRMKRNRIIRRMISYAAILLMIAGTGYIWYTRLPDHPIVPSGSLLCRQPGEQIAVLQLASGAEVPLHGGESRILEISGGVVLKQDSVQGLMYSLQEEGESVEVEYNTIRVPKGGEYKLTLADESGVWMNSASELRFPTHFSGDKREVYLLGEAYFDVGVDPDRPFVVRTGNAFVTVLGTAFNVMAYPEDLTVEVALSRGKVNFTSVGTQQECLLVPGNVVRMDKKNNQIVMTDEDVEVISAWRSGYFYFENMPMEQLVVKLERWYQVKFSFADEHVKDMCFTGALTKYRDLDYVLGIIAKTKDIDFKDMGDQIRITRK